MHWNVRSNAVQFDLDNRKKTKDMPMAVPQTAANFGKMSSHSIATYSAASDS